MKIRQWIARESSKWLVAKKPNWDEIATTSAKLVPEPEIWRLFERAVADVCVALCLHRVSTGERDEMTMSAYELDRFLEYATSIRRADPWLTLSFDDGYAEAAEYIDTRAPRFPGVEWLLLVCPEKAELRAGFRWDLESGDESERDPTSENMRADLQRVGESGRHPVASVAQCRSIERHANVSLGNHTNCHFRVEDLPFDLARMELHKSDEHFRRLFGDVKHFAFPFGKPGEDFDERHVEVLREQGDFLIWTTSRRPYHAADRKPGAVLPRFPVNGSWTASQVAFWIALLSMRWRDQVIDPKYDIPPPPESLPGGRLPPDGTE